MLKNNWLFIVFIIITAITSWFSIGFFHVDEHYQVLEFGGYKAGMVPQQDLPWEFPNAVRSSIQPFIVFLFIKALSIFHIGNPFIVTLLLRLLTAILSIFCFNLWRNHIKRLPDSKIYLKWYDAALLLWFIPFLSVRFSSEIIGGCLFFISLALVYGKNESSPWRFLIAGGLASLGFFIRFQTGFLIAGFLLFRVFDSRRNFINLAGYGLGFIAVTAMSVYLDYLFYNKWCFTPWNYFRENIIYAKAASFGIEPFYYYLPRILLNAVPFQGIFILGAFIIYLIKKFRDEISIGVLLFLAGHFITAHKEMRFMFPLIFILPFVFAYSMVWISQFHFSKSIYFKILVILTVITNLLLLPIVATRPADYQAAMQKAIYRAVGNDKAIVFYKNENPFARVLLKMNFYRNENMKLLPVDSLQQYSNGLKEKFLLVTTLNASSPLTDEPDWVCIYQNIPQWVLALNFNDWLSRTSVYRLYELKTEGT